MALSKLAKQYAKRLEAADTFDAVMAVARDVDADAEYHKALSRDEKRELSKLFAERLTSVSGIESRAHLYKPVRRRPNGRRI